MKKIYLLAALAFLASTLSGQTDWVKYAGNPVLEPGVEDDGAARGGPVVYHDGVFHMWYSKSYTDTIDAHIGYATSPDGIQWTKYGDNPVLLTGPEGSWDELQCFFPTVLIRDNVFHMWYLGRAGGSDSNERKIGHATSSDGIHWEKDPQNPVLDRGPEGSPDAYYILALSASHDDSLFHLWYGANNGLDDFYYTCHATSEDGSVWSKDPENPVLTGDIWDTPLCLPGPTLFDGSGFQMWYTGGESGTTRKVGYATSADGTDWVKPSVSPVLEGGQPGEWDEGPVAIRGIVYDNTTAKYLMWYSGTNGVGYAETTETAWKMMNNDAKGGMTLVSDSLIYSFATGGEDWWIGNQTWRYDTNTNTWTQLEDMPMSMIGGGIGQIGDKIYLAAGWRNTSDTDYSWITVDSILEYDMSGDTFVFRQKAPNKMGSMVSCMMNDEMYLFGGMEIQGELIYPYKARKYDPVTELWDTTSVPDMLYPFLMHGTAEVLNGEIFVIGGHGPGPDFIFLRSEKFDGGEWTPIAEMPVPSVLHTSVVHDNKILLFGGDDFWSPPASNSISLIQEYDPLDDSWRLMEPMPFRRSAMGGGKVGKFVYLSGGMLDDRDPETGVSEVWRFNLDSLQEWCEEVSIMQPLVSLEVDDEITLDVNVVPSDFANKDLLWISDDTLVASISETGVVTCNALGTAMITAKLKFGGCSGSIILECTDISAPELSIDKDTIDLRKDTSVQVTSSEKGYVYLVQEGTEKDISAIRDGMIQDSLEVEAETGTELALTATNPGTTYWIYARDEFYNISEYDAIVVLDTTIDVIYQQIHETIRIYPNPAGNLLAIETGISGSYNIKITSINGQVIFNKEMEVPVCEIDISSIRKGVYLITIRSEDFVTTKKIIKP